MRRRTYNQQIAAPGKYIIIKGNVQTYISNDYGKTWRENLYLAHGYSCSGMSGNGQIQLIAIFGVTKISNDFGNNWNDFTALDAFYGTAISFTGNILIRCNENAIYISRDYGKTYSIDCKAKISQMAPNHNIAISHNNKRLYAAGGQLILVSDASTKIWNVSEIWNSYSSRYAEYVKSVAITDDGETMYANIDNNLFKYNISVDQWEIVAIGFFNYCFVSGGIAISSHGQYIMLDNGGSDISSSSDYGVTWTSHRFAGSTYVRNIRKLVMSSNGQVRMVLGEDNNISYSTDFGKNWQSMSVPSINIVNISTNII